MIQKNGFSLNRYYHEISKTPLLSAKEELALARRCKQGDPIAKQNLVEANLRFVVKMAIPYSNYGLSLEDLIQEGNLGLLEGIDKFDPEKGFRLTTYVSWWIRLALQRAVEQKSAQVRIPANKQEQLKKIKAYQVQFEAKNGRAPRATEISNGLKMKSKQVEELLNLDATYYSLEVSVDEDSPSLQNILEDGRVVHPEEDIAEREMGDRLGKAMRVLSDKERNVLSHRYGLDSNEGKSLRQIGRLIGLSAEGVRRIEEQALRKLRRPMVRSYVEGFI
ncbi:MAG: RNA polymerase sigma factor RpoD/SigA [Candidatus Omnitrophica bacterium]|nr:RNA polymerase sigma factor RpoD/SigA [Candidatus Omnitrophota bacterium]MCA9415490.1 RNA polymerase sigma factor RpoD/SigA [Candidatus Omnitrophota bacterium]MCA9423985.1 RNA polymerase sigma factor RpoD/SigA [Candidatus Omnitrophota bacterium]MCA9429752.1 RNA polymerase sigma factor RpoD/SigA [Candidatus Omnitrophota bacterium]MCB9770707.1 RNA polymerase sigma factor RpoD/SigA [Candidatus Omnitrophota bacterium]